MCTVDSEEIRRLSKYFKKLDLNNDGKLSVDEFMSIPELQQNPLVRRVIEIMDEDGNGQIDFREFIQGLSQFSLKSDKQSRLKCEEAQRCTYSQLPVISTHVQLRYNITKHICTCQAAVLECNG